MGFKYFKNMIIHSAQYYSSNNCSSKYFEKRMLKIFECLNVSVPSGYKKLLNLWYGKYMILPTEEEQKPKHGFVAFWR